MYCRYCGKEIQDDSHYCNYCGKELLPSVTNTNDSSHFELLAKFKTLSAKKQALIICYILWLTICICGILDGVGEIYEYDGNTALSDVVYPYILVGIILPVDIICIRYLIILYKNQKKIKKQSAMSFPVNVQQPNAMSSNNSYDTIKLADFAEKMGQMKIIKKNVGQPTETVYYAFVQNEIVTAEVELAPGMPLLSADEISKQKDSLCIKRNPSGKYELGFAPHQ
jgi:hypothetical protein